MSKRRSWRRFITPPFSRFIRTIFLVALSAGSLVSNVETSIASPLAGSVSGALKPVRRNPAFVTPPELRPRVNFWIDVFSKYGKDQKVIHHRDFPQVQFKILDFTKAAAELGPVQLDLLKQRVEREKVAEIANAVKKLASGAEPETSLEKHIVNQMAFLPGGRSKYQKMLDDDLIRTQTGIKEKFGEAVRRTGRYLYFIERIFVDEYGLPVELTRIPFIESSFDYNAYSSVGAAGIWQFMRATGKKYMTVNNLIDERRDPLAATRGAAQYLRSAYSSLGTWPLAVTSYNHGVAGVYRKMKDFGTTDLARAIEHPTERVFGFASTNFYPELLAAIEIYDDYEHYFPGIQLEPPLRVKEHRLSRSMSVDQVARMLGTTKDELERVNYAVSDMIWSGRRPIPAGYVLKVPMEFEAQASKLAGPMQEPASTPVGGSVSAVRGGITYTVRKGDTLLSIAKKYKTSVQTLVDLNQVSAKTLRVGQLLTIRQREDSTEGMVVKATPVVSEPKSISAPAAATKAPVSIKKAEVKREKKEKREETPSRRTHTVRSGDSLWSIAKQYGVSVETLKRNNKVSAGGLKPGQKIVVSR